MQVSKKRKLDPAEFPTDINDIIIQYLVCDTVRFIEIMKEIINEHGFACGISRFIDTGESFVTFDRKIFYIEHKIIYIKQKSGKSKKYQHIDQSTAQELFDQLEKIEI